MSKFCLLVACLLLSAQAAANDIVLNNPDFEDVMVGNRIPGWSRTQHAGVRAYEITSDTGSFDNGKASIRMLRTTEQAYGLIMQQLATPGLAGKTIEFVAALKGESVGDKGWVMVLTFKNHGSILEQVRAEPVTGDMDWKDVVITKLAPLGTTHIEVGFMLLDSGAGWADNVRLRTLDEDHPKTDPAAADMNSDGTPATDKAKSAKPATRNDANGAPSAKKGDH